MAVKKILEKDIENYLRDEIKKMELYILESNINKEPVHVKEENCDGQFDS